MPKSQRLRLREITAVHDLVSEIAEQGADCTRWRTHAVLGLTRLVHGNVGLTLDMQDVLPGRIPRPIDCIDLGWATQASRDFFHQYCLEEVKRDPGAKALIDIHSKVRFASFCRREMIDDTTWYNARSVSEMRRGGDVYDFVCSSIAVRPGWLHGFIVYRPWGATPFEAHERRLLRYFHARLYRLYRDSLNHAAGPRAGLPPRVAQVLDLLLTGSSMKQIASHLDISHSTPSTITPNSCTADSVSTAEANCLAGAFRTIALNPRFNCQRGWVCEDKAAWKSKLENLNPKSTLTPPPGFR